MESRPINPGTNREAGELGGSDEKRTHLFMPSIKDKIPTTGRPAFGCREVLKAGETHGFINVWQGDLAPLAAGHRGLGLGWRSSVG